MSYQVSRQWDLFVEGGYLRTGSYDFDVKETGDTRTVVNNSELDTRGVKRDVTTRVVDTLTPEEVAVSKEVEIYLPNAVLSYNPGGGEMPPSTTVCSDVYGNTGTSGFGPPPAICYEDTVITTDNKIFIKGKETDTVITERTLLDKTNKTSTTTLIRRPKVSDMNFGPADGWSLRLGFRWFFNQPKIKEVAVVADPEPEVKPEPTPVRGLW